MEGNGLSFTSWRLCDRTPVPEDSGTPFSAPRVEESHIDGKERSRKLQVFVKDNNIDQALRVLKKKMQREGLYREMKRRRSYENPSERRARETGEAVRRHRKLMRKRMEREGY